MKRLLRLSILQMLLSAVSASYPAYADTDHTPRDGNLLHPGMANSRELILSISDSTSTFLLNPAAASFDDCCDAYVYISTITENTYHAASGLLTAAEYGEHADLKTNTNRYTERLLEFMPNGGVRRLQRHGLKADGVYGKVDNLRIYYDGNRITGVLDDAGLVTQNGSMDFPVSGRETAFGYNEWGALVKDESRGITDISYDRFGNPLRISYANGAYTENVYSATGEKLRMTYGTTLGASSAGIELYCDMDFAEAAGQDAMAAVASATIVTEYHGNVIYKDGKVDMVLFPGGYATVNGTAVTFHYYTQDCLGNIRAVINGSTGAIEQTTAYYPYGGIIADLGNP